MARTAAVFCLVLPPLLEVRVWVWSKVCPRFFSDLISGRAIISHCVYTVLLTLCSDLFISVGSPISKFIPNTESLACLRSALCSEIEVAFFFSKCQTVKPFQKVLGQTKEKYYISLFRIWTWGLLVRWFIPLVMLTQISSFIWNETEYFWFIRIIRIYLKILTMGTLKIYYIFYTVDNHLKLIFMSVFIWKITWKMTHCGDIEHLITLELW